LTELQTAYGRCWQALGLDRLVSSCGNLQKLSLCCTPGLQLTALLQLTDLDHLWLGGQIDSSTMASLSHLTGLRKLQRLAVTDACGVSSRLFLPLTALTQLTYLALPQRSEFGASMQLLRKLYVNKRFDVDSWPTAFCIVITNTVSGLFGV